MTQPAKFKKAYMTNAQQNEICIALKKHISDIEKVIKENDVPRSFYSIDNQKKYLINATEALELIEYAS